MFSKPAVTRQHAAAIRRISSVIECSEVKRVHRTSQASGIIALTFTA